MFSCDNSAPPSGGRVLSEGTFYGGKGKDMQREKSKSQNRGSGAVQCELISISDFYEVVKCHVLFTDHRGHVRQTEDHRQKSDQEAISLGLVVSERAQSQ